MKTLRFRSWNTLTLVMVTALMAVTLPDVFAQYSIQQNAFSTVGGKSAGGTFSLRSSTGQPTTGTPMSGGTFSLQGSPWNVIALQSAGAPLLNISRTNGLLRVSWPSPSTGFLLQETTELRATPVTTPWTNSALTVADNGTEKSVTVAPGAGLKYFRLQKTP